MLVVADQCFRDARIQHRELRDTFLNPADARGELRRRPFDVLPRQPFGECAANRLGKRLAGRLRQRPGQRPGQPVGFVVLDAECYGSEERLYQIYIA